MDPIKVFTKAIVVSEYKNDPSLYCVTVYVDDKVFAVFLPKPRDEALALAECLAKNDSPKETAPRRRPAAK